jgi:hypothetical protein
VTDVPEVFNTGKLIPMVVVWPVDDGKNGLHIPEKYSNPTYTNGRG